MFFCAVSEWYPELRRRLGKKNITLSPGCNNLAKTIDGIAKWLHIPPLKLVPVNPLKSLLLLVKARLHGSKAIIPPVARF